MRLSGPGAALRLESASMRAVGTALTVLFAVASIALLVERFAAPFALGAALFLGAAIVLLLRPELATALTAFLLYINFPAILTKQHGMPPVVAGSFILLLGFPILKSLLARRERFRADRTFFLMIALLGALLLSSFKSIDRSISTNYIKDFVLEGLLLYWLIINAIRSMETLRRVIWSVLFAGGLLGALSLYQTVTGNYEQEFHGLAYRKIDISEDEREIVLDVAQPKRNSWDRAGGPVGQPNRFAQLLLVLLPLGVFSVRHARTRSLRLAAAGLGALTLAGVALTLSRGSFVWLVVMTGMMVAMKWIRYSRVLICVLIFALVAPSVPFFVERISKTVNVKNIFGAREERTESQVADGALLGRATLMNSALHVFMDHPVIGVGPGQFPRFYSVRYANQAGVGFRDMPNRNWRAHSLYLELAADLGIVGLGAFLASVWVVVAGLWRARRYWLLRNPEYADLATAFWLSLTAYLGTGVIQHLAYQPYYWFLLALSSAALHVLLSRQAAEAPELGASAGAPPLGIRQSA